MVSRDIIQRLLAIINDTRARLNTLESREVALLTATQTLTNKTLTTPTIGNFTNAQHAHTGATSGGTISHGSLTDLTTGDPHTQYLLESTYDANTILKADADNTPIALTVGASTIVGRASTGNIAALTAAQVATIVQGSIDHSQLTNLTTGDPHTQYLLESTYDANTILKADADNTPIALTVDASTIVGRASTGNIAALTAAQVATIVQGSIDHGSIAGLADDDHTGYARLAGRSGGQTLIGGTAANDDLTLEGTSSATRTTSYVILQPNGGNVGIGTTSPSGKLEIVGDAAVNSRSITASVAPGAIGRSGSFVLKSTLDSALGSFDAARLSFYGNQTWQNAADYLGFDIATGNDTWATKMALLGNGNVGIGTTSPSGKLEIVGDAAVNSRSITASVAPGAAGRSGSFVLKSTLDSALGSFDAARLSFYGNQTWQNAADYLGFDIATGNDTWATKMALLGNGNVGIGTTSPSGKLEIVGDAAVNSRSITASVAPGATGRSGSFVLKSTLDSPSGPFDAARLSFYGNETWQSAADYLGFDIATGNDTWATKMALLGNGNVGIGTTSPSRKLHVAGTILIDGDEGGIAGTIGLTDVNDLAARSTGVGTIKFNDATNRDSSGFVKIYIGVTEYYIPVFAAI